MANLRHSLRHQLLFSALALFTMLNPTVVRAQQAEIPATPVDESVAEQAQSTGSERIVDGRPTMYSFKRAIHPFEWIDAGFSPLLKLAEKAGGKVSTQGKSPRTSGVKFLIKGLGPGSGFGPEIKPYNKNLFNTGIEVEAPIAVTYQLYQRARLSAMVPLIRGENLPRLGMEFSGTYFSRADENFFGLGNDSAVYNDGRYRSVTRSAGAGLVARNNGPWSVRVDLGYRSVGITSPRRFTSAQDVFGGVRILGLTEDPGATFASAGAALQRDSRDSPHLPSSGGLQRVEATLNEGISGGDFSYWRYRGELQQYIPLSGDHREVLGLRAKVETNQEKGGSTIPFFDLPTIGGHDTVRGFEPRRFADRSAMSATVEYSYRIWQYFDAGVFADAGQVAPEVRNFAMDRFHTGYGLRFVMRTEGHRGLIFDVAHSRERKVMFYLDFSHLF